MENDDASPKARTRSPAYPNISLPTAVEYARKIWDTQRRHEAHIDSTLKAIGYNTRNGTALRTIGALNHYGLIEESGSKDDRKIKLSEAALDILHLADDDQRKHGASRTAALAPAIHAALYERYGTHLPDDSAIRPYLLRDKGYNDSVIDNVLQNYRDSFEFAKLATSSNDGADKDGSEKPIIPAPVTIARQIAPLVVPATPPMNTSTHAQELPILVGPGLVARIPFPMTEDDYQLLLGTLTLWKKKIVKSAELDAAKETPTS